MMCLRLSPPHVYQDKTKRVGLFLNAITVTDDSPTCTRSRLFVSLRISTRPPLPRTRRSFFLVYLLIWLYEPTFPPTIFGHYLCAVQSHRADSSVLGRLDWWQKTLVASVQACSSFAVKVVILLTDSCLCTTGRMLYFESQLDDNRANLVDSLGYFVTIPADHYTIICYTLKKTTTNYSYDSEKSNIGFFWSDQYMVEVWVCGMWHVELLMLVCVNFHTHTHTRLCFRSLNIKWSILNSVMCGNISSKKAMESHVIRAMLF